MLFSLILLLFISDPGKLSSCNLCRRIGSERNIGKTVFLFAVLVPRKQLQGKLFQGRVCACCCVRPVQWVWELVENSQYRQWPVNIDNDQRAQMPNPKKSLLKSAVDHRVPNEAISYYTDAFNIILHSCLESPLENRLPYSMLCSECRCLSCSSLWFSAWSWWFCLRCTISPQHF